MTATSWSERYATERTERDRLEHLATGRRAFAEKAAEITKRYEGRRTIHAGMVREMLDLLDGRVAELEAQHADVVAGLVAGHAATVDRLTAEVTERQQTVTNLLATLQEKRALNEARASTGDAVKVTIDRSLGGWTIADLEEIAYRLRVGGASDETSVKMTDYSATATVPAPDLIPLHRPGTAPAPLVLDPPQYETTDANAVPRWWIAASLLVGGGVLAAVVDVIVRAVS